MFPFSKTKAETNASDELCQKGIRECEKGNFTEGVKILQRAASEDHPGAWTRLGFMYGHGQYFDVDEVKEEEYLRHASEQGYAPAQAMLAFLYLNGAHAVVSKDRLEATHFLLQALEQDCPEAVGVALLGGLCNFPQDTEEACNHFRNLLAEEEQDSVKVLLMYSLMSLAESDSSAEEELAALLDDLVEREITTASFVKVLLEIRREAEMEPTDEQLLALEQAAGRNQADAMLLLGNYYASHDREEEASPLLEKAAQQNRGNALFQRALADYERNMEDCAGPVEEFTERKELIRSMEEAAQRGESEAYPAVASALESLDPDRAATACFKGTLHQQKDALNALGRMYNNGFGTTPAQPERAVTYFKEAILQGCAEAHVHLGEAYLNGEGIGMDAFAAMGHFYAAAMKGEPRGMFLYGKMLCDGILDFSDDEEGMKWIRKSAELKDPDGMMYCFEKSTSAMNELEEEEILKLDELLEEAADLGQTDAQLLCGLKYLNGLNGEVDPEKAMHYFMDSGENGNMEAVYWVGFMNLHGIGVKANAEHARICFRKAAEGGSMSARYEYGKMLHAEKNYIYSHQLFLDAAEQGHVQALEMLAQMYEKGLGVPQDKEQAQQYREQAEMLKELEEAASSDPEN